MIAVVVVAGVTGAAGQNRSSDYAQWRGPNRDGSAVGFVEPKAWPEKLNLKWKIDVGPGYATPIVVGNRVYTHTRQADDEVMMSLDAATGKTVWKTPYPAPYKMNPATSGHGRGPKSTPLYHNGKLYTLGISGIVSAFDASNGKLLWQKAGPSVDPLYGTAMSPVADGGAILVHVGGHNNGALTAFDANTGDVKWAWTGDGPGYASPIIATFGGTRQVISITQTKVVGLNAATGELLWQQPFISRSVNNSITPIVYGDTVIVSGHELGVKALKPAKSATGWTAETIWETSEVSMFMSNPVLVGDTLYGLSHKNSGQYFALDVKTGKVLWLGQPRQATNSAVVKAGNVLFFLNEDGQLIVARTSPTAFEPIQHYTVAESATWAQPTVSGNRIFVKDVSNLALWTLN
jgi:outer membrane protein assembly factor BamB